MKKENLDDYELFYMELPQADYLRDIEIQDDIDPHDYDQVQGLSPDQVQQIAQDSLDAADGANSPQDLDTSSSDSDQSPEA